MSQAPDRSSPRRNLDDDVASPTDQQRAGSRRRSSRERRTRVVGPRHPPPAPEAAAAAPRSPPDDDDDDDATPSHPRREASSPRWRGYRRASSSSSGGFPPSPSSPPPSPRSSYSSPSHHHHHHRAVSSLLSSRASDMGRRLAQERSRNRTLTRRISELEDALSLLRHGDIVANGDDPIRRGVEEDDDSDGDASCDDPTWEEAAHSFSSHPAETPPRESRRLPAKLEEASSRSGTKPRREAAEEEEGAEYLMPPSTSACAGVADMPSPRTTTTIEISGGDRSSIEDILDRAAELMAGGGGIRRIGTTADASSAAGVTTRERMHEYRELLTAFHSEQISHADLDGEELIPRVDVSWLLNELRWRYEDILDGYEEERRSGEEERDNSHHDRELRECVESLAGIVRKAIESPPAHRNDRGQRRDPSIADDERDEISSLNQRLASFALQHTEICSSHYDDVEAMKRDFLEQLENKSQFAQHLESKISEQEEYIVRIQNEAQMARQSMEEEKRKLAMSKEGTSARIRYLEGMLRSLQVELRDKERVNRELQGAASTPPPVFLRDLTSAMRETDPWDEERRMQIGAANSPPPMFPRDLAFPMRDANPRYESSPPPVIPSDPTSTIRKADRRHESPMRDGADPTDELECSRGDARPSVDGADDIATLREQIASLGSSLAESETRRADMLEDFQRERREYMSQYERLSDVLKKLIEERGNAIVLGDDVSVQML